MEWVKKMLLHNLGKYLQCGDTKLYIVAKKRRKLIWCMAVPCRLLLSGVCGGRLVLCAEINCYVVFRHVVR